MFRILMKSVACLCTTLDHKSSNTKTQCLKNDETAIAQKQNPVNVIRKISARTLENLSINMYRKSVKWFEIDFKSLKTFIYETIL